MASTRLSQRFPVRPSAQHSPSPDMGAKSLIISTTPPKVNKQHLTSKKQRDQSIIKIREQNKKLKEEMKSLLVKNKIVEEPKQEEDVKRSRINSKSQIMGNQKVFNDRQTQKQSYTKPSSSVNQSTLPLNISAIKEELNLMIRDKQQKLFDRITQLQNRLKQSEQKQKLLQDKVNEYKSELQTSIKRKINFDSSPIAPNRRRQDDSPMFLNTTPIKQLSPSQSHRDLIHQLQIQLSGAQSTIRRLETILETQQKSYSSLKFDSDRKQLVISELKRELSDVKSEAKQLSARKENSQRKESNQKRQIKSFYEKQIHQLNSLIEELQKKLLSKQKEVRELERTNIDIRLKLNEEKQEQIISLKQQISDHKQEIKRLSQEANSSIRSSQVRVHRLQQNKQKDKDSSYIDNLHSKLHLMSQKLRDCETQINQSKIYIATLQSQHKKLQQTNTQYLNKISFLEQDNQKLKQNFDKVRQELDEIGVINSRLSIQKNEVELLTSQLTQALKNLQVTKQQHKSQTISYLNQVKTIRSMTQSINIQQIELSDKPNTQKQNQNYNNQIQSLNLKHKQQTLKLSTIISSNQTEKQKLKQSILILEKQNTSLKQQIETLNNSIRNYSRPIPYKEISHEEIESIILKEENKPNIRVDNANKILNGVSNRLGKLYDEINKGRE